MLDDDGDMTFLAQFDGQEPQTFPDFAGCDDLGRRPRQPNWRSLVRRPSDHPL